MRLSIPVATHKVIQWNGVELILRTKTVDLENVHWLGQSWFWKLFERSATTSRDVVLDLGAHIGSFGILASHTRGCRVVAFEPDRDSMRLCRANALPNEFEDRFEFVEAAVGGSDCTVRREDAQLQPRLVFIVVSRDALRRQRQVVNRSLGKAKMSSQNPSDSSQKPLGSQRFRSLLVLWLDIFWLPVGYQKH